MNKLASQAGSDLRSSIVRRPLRPYEHLEISPKPSPAKALADSRHQIVNGFTFSKGWTMPIQTPIDWTYGSRSTNFHLHAFAPISAQIVAYDLTGRKSALKTATAFAFDWIRNNLDLSGDDLGETVEACLADPHESRWYDMAIGQRLQKMAYLLDVLARSDTVQDRLIAKLAIAIRLHHRLLADPRVFRAGTNHGFFQAMTQYAAATRLPELDDSNYAALSHARLGDMVDQQFHPDGMHAEHSPGYHHMVTIALINMRNAGLLDDRLAMQIEIYERTLVDLIKPDGGIATIGDTDPKNLWENERYDGFFDNREMRFVVSGAKEGSPPPSGVSGHFSSGYAVARLNPNGTDSASFREQSYLVHKAGFHSRTHKQADHLTFIWHEHGKDILSDPGRFAYTGRTLKGDQLYEAGFYYSDPKRIYAEKTRAHNCVEIDGKSHQRIGVQFFGSALKRAEQSGELAIMHSATALEGTVIQSRTLLLRPAHFLLVLDELTDHECEHEYRQWFCLGPKWRASNRSVDGVIRAITDPHKPSERRLTAISITSGLDWETPVRGQTDPELLGWVSDRANRLIPATSLCLSAPRSTDARFATLFVLGANAIIDRSETDLDDEGRLKQTRWRDALGTHCLQIERDAGGACQPRFRTIVPI